MVNKSKAGEKITNIYLYDFDGTIVKGDTGVKFFWWWSKKYPFVFVWLPYFALYLFLYKFKFISHKILKEKFFRFLPSDKTFAKEQIEEFWNSSNKKQLNKKVVQMIKKDNLDNDGIVVCISGSPDFFIKPMVDMLPVDVLICTNTYKNNYRKIIGENCNGQEKVKRLFNWIKQEKIKSYAFIKTVSDSQKDLPIYELAKNWYAVDMNGNIKKGLPDKKGTFYWK